MLLRARRIRAALARQPLAHGEPGRRSKPLQIWDKKVRNGHIKRITDQDIQSSVLEIVGTNVSTTFITCPADARKTLGIKLPFLVMIIKNVRALAARRARVACPCPWEQAALNQPAPCCVAAEKVLHL